MILPEVPTNSQAIKGFYKGSSTPSVGASQAKVTAHKGFVAIPLPDKAEAKKSVKGKDCLAINLDIDAEWNSKAGKSNQFITLQIRDTRSNEVSVIEHPSLGDRRLPSWKGLTPLPELLGADEHWGQPNFEVEGRLNTTLTMFFSFGDIRAFFNNHAVCRTIQKQCEQKRRINHQGTIDLDYYLQIEDVWYQVYFEIVDVCGLMGMGGLKAYAAKIGLELEDKGLMDDYKSDMLKAYRDPELFDAYVDYSAGDCVSDVILQKFAEKLESEIYTALGLREGDKGEKVDVATMPRTIGATTEKLFRTFIQRRVLSDWTPGAKSENVSNFNAQHLLYPVAYDPEIDTNYVSADWILGRGSVKTSIDSVNRDTTEIFNLLVQGGRCKNERSIDFKASGIIGDSDISGCYGNGLMNQAYPIGLPTTIRYGYRQQRVSLAEFLEKWEGELVPGLWQLVADTEDLSFEQSLIFSKPISDAAFYKLVKAKYDIEDPEVDVNFGLYTQEIQNGIINHDILQALRAVMSAQEWSEFAAKTMIKTGMFYPASQRCESAKEWAKEIAQRPGLIECDLSDEFHHIDTDKRSRKWFSFSLAEFIGPLLATRSELKKERSQHKKGSPQWIELNAKQELFKLFINTTYGVLASPYFDSGNAVVANNITARARVLAWSMSVACGGIQSITDGSAYDMNALRLPGRKFPSMDTLTKLNRGLVAQNTLKDCLKTVPLGGKEWSFVSASNGSIVLKFGDDEVVGGDGNWPLIDKLYKEHLQQFFKGKGIDCIEQFDFEHKNIYSEIIFQSQSNYRFTTFEGEHKIKARGHSLKKDRVGINGEKLDSAAIEQLFKDLENGYTRPYRTEITSAPLKVNAANEGGAEIEAGGLLAGDSITKKLLISSISLSGFMWKTHAQKQTWDRYNEKLKAKKGWGIDGVFYNPETGLIDYARAIVEIQAAIDAGKNWVPGFKDEKKIPIHPIWEEEQNYVAVTSEEISEKKKHRNTSAPKKLKTNDDTETAIPERRMEIHTQLGFSRDVPPKRSRKLRA